MTPEALNELMDLDHVVTVHEDGTVSEPRNIWAPECLDGDVSSGWSLLDGYSGQYRYSGPIMHESEFLGGRMADDILSTPGTYAVVVAYYSPEDDDDSDSDLEVGGWAVAVLDAS